MATLAAETLFRMGQEDLAFKTYSRMLMDTTTYGMIDRNFALNSIDAINARSSELENSVMKLYEKRKHILEGNERYNAFDALMAQTLLKKWELI